MNKSTDKNLVGKYNLLLEANTIIKQIKIQNIYSGYLGEKNHLRDNTLIFEGRSSKSLVFKKNNKYSIDHYCIEFVVGRNPDGTHHAPILYCNDCIKKKNEEGCYRCHIYYDVCDFHENFFTSNPKIKVISCDNYGCRNSLEKNNIWCNLCHERCEDHPLELIVKDEIELSDIPLESILHIEHCSELIDIKKDTELSKVIRFLDEEICYAEELKKSIIENKKRDERKILKIKLSNHLQKYGGSVDSMKMLSKDLFEKSGLYKILLRHGVISFES